MTVPGGLTARRLDVGSSAVVIFSYPVAPLDLAVLSKAERDVVARALAGASNAQIARARKTAVRTVANLLARAYRKLGVSSRREVAAMLSMQGS
jgi:DNA-binding CsgD family transcriptional regulator